MRTIKCRILVLTMYPDKPDTKIYSITPGRRSYRVATSFSTTCRLIKHY